MKSKITVFFGVMGSGKDYRLQNLIKEDKNLKVLNMKDGLVKIAETVNPFRLSYEDFKICVLGAKSVEESRALLDMNPYLITGRKFLQQVGTEGLRALDADFHVNYFDKRARTLISQGYNIAVADVRFENEFKHILALPAKKEFIFCNYKSDRYDAGNKHESERLAQRFLKMHPSLEDGAKISLVDIHELIGDVYDA